MDTQPTNGKFIVPIGPQHPALKNLGILRLAWMAKW